VDDKVVAGLLEQLPQAAVLRHSGRTFLEHLLCTWRILTDWGMPVAVCRAGFLHSAYSTSFYRHALFRLDERDTVKRMIGREAEELAFRFCTMDRRGFWDVLAKSHVKGALTYPDRLRAGRPVRVARKTLSRLLIIESANVAEQSKASDGGPAPWMSRVLRWWKFLDERSIPSRFAIRPALAKGAEERAIESYRAALTLPAVRALPLLDDAVRQNPWAGEPRILRALCARQTARDAIARQDARCGSELLATWAVAWDKRLRVEGWQAVAARVEKTATRSSSARLDYASVCASLADQRGMPKWMRV
jgi:hypothetical protein